MNFHRDLNCVALPGDVRVAASKCGVGGLQDLGAWVDRHPGGILTDQNVVDSVRARIACQYSAGGEVMRVQQQLHIHTGCGALDQLLGGGITCGGVPGAGKTQLGMQVALNVQLPEWLGGQNGECVILDTEGSVMAQRLAVMADGAARRAHAAVSTQQQWQQVEGITQSSLLNGIRYIRCQDACELVSACVTLLMNRNPKVKVVVIDSVAFVFRFHRAAASKRVCMVHTMMSSLRRLAALGVAIIIVNQVTGFTGSSSDEFAPALGDAWSSEPTHRVMISVSPQQRTASIWKSPSRPPGSACFSVGPDGIHS